MMIDCWRVPLKPTEKEFWSTTPDLLTPVPLAWEGVIRFVPLREQHNKIISIFSEYIENIC